MCRKIHGCGCFADDPAPRESVAGEEEVLIEGVEVEVEAEEVAEDAGVGQKKYEEPGPRGSAADFLLCEGRAGRRWRRLQ